jgi:hypothetical protein
MIESSSQANSAYIRGRLIHVQGGVEKPCETALEMSG